MNFIEECNKKKDELLSTRDGFRKEYVNKFGFKMKNSIDIPIELILYFVKNVDRNNTINRFKKYIDNDVISRNIERGLFEYSLLKVMEKGLQYYLVVPTYLYTMENICINLDINNGNISNKTFLKAILYNQIKPYLVPFLSPQQIHPERWEIIMQKKMRDDDATYNIETSDKYQCPKCGERKCLTTLIQLRGADEPENKFIICVVCGTTVIE